MYWIFRANKEEMTLAVIPYDSFIPSMPEPFIPKRAFPPLGCGSQGRATSSLAFVRGKATSSPILEESSTPRPLAAEERDTTLNSLFRGPWSLVFCLTQWLEVSNFEKSRFSWKKTKWPLLWNWVLVIGFCAGFIKVLCGFTSAAVKYWKYKTKLIKCVPN